MSSILQPEEKVKRKLASILHDPMFKVYVIRSTPTLNRDFHVEFAEKMASKILSEIELEERLKEEIISDIINHHSKNYYLSYADKESSNANRVFIPKGLKADDITIAQPFTGYVFSSRRKPPNFHSIQFEESVKIHFDQKDYPNIKDALKSDAWFRSYYRIAKNLFRMYNGFPNIRERAFIIPEDTRVPTSPMISHLLTTSNLSLLVNNDGVGLNGYIVRFDLGGVQEFISKSKTSRDFWISSLLLSLINYSFMVPIIEKYGFDAIIYPWLLDIPIVDFHHGIGSNDLLNKMLYPVIPNSFLALIPKEDEPIKIIKDIVGKAEEFWGEIVNYYKKTLEEILKKELKIEDVQFEGLIKTLFDDAYELDFYDVFRKIRIGIIELPDAPILKSQNWEGIRKTLLDKIKDKQLQDLLLSELLNRGDTREKLLEYKTYRVMENYHTITKVSQLDIGARKFMQNFKFKKREAKWETKRRFERKKCTLCGVNNALPLTEEEWEKLEKTPLIDFGERLCHLCMLKRVIARTTLSEKEETKRSIVEIFKPLIRNMNESQSEEIISEIEKETGRLFPSLNDFSTIWFRVTLLLLYISRYDELESKIGNKLVKIEKSYMVISKLIDSGELPELSFFKETESIEKYKKFLDSNFPILKLLGDMFKKKRAKKVLPKSIYIPSAYLRKESLEAMIKEANQSKQENDEKAEKLKELIKQLNEFSEELEKLHEELKNYIRDLFDMSDSKTIMNEIMGMLLEVATSIVGSPDVKRILKNVLRIDHLPLSYKPTNNFVLLRSDGDWMGRWLSGDMLPNFFTLFHRNVAREYINTLRNNKELDPQLKELLLNPEFRRLPSPAFQSTVSMVLSNMAINVFPKIVEAFGGKLVYSGGDDVLAYLPPETWWIVASLIRVLYSAEFLRISGEGNKEFWIPGMSHRASMSFGVVIANIKADLRKVINLAGELEEISKSICYLKEAKDGLSVAILSRGDFKTRILGIPWFIVMERKGETEKKNEGQVSSDIYLLREYIDEKLDNWKGEFNSDFIEKYMERINGIYKNMETVNFIIRVNDFYGIGNRDCFDFESQPSEDSTTTTGDPNRKKINCANVLPLLPFELYLAINWGKENVTFKEGKQNLVLSRRALYEILKFLKDYERTEDPLARKSLLLILKGNLIRKIGGTGDRGVAKKQLNKILRAIEMLGEKTVYLALNDSCHKAEKIHTSLQNNQKGANLDETIDVYNLSRAFYLLKVFDESLQSSILLPI